MHIGDDLFAGTIFGLAKILVLAKRELCLLLARRANFKNFPKSSFALLAALRLNSSSSNNYNS